jgi:nucleoside-diphosphate-sugar epimerase
LSKILVTGGAGFIGSSIVNYYSENGNDVFVFDNFSRGDKRRIRPSRNVNLIDGDIKDLEALEKVFQNDEFETVIHLAYINGTQNFYSRPTEVFDVALQGMQNMVKVVSAQNVHNFLLASSSEVYQNPFIFPTPEKIPLVVPDPSNPRYSYGLGKIVQEFMALHYLADIERVIVFRPHNIYGPDMGYGHVIPELFTKILKSNNGEVLLKGNGMQTRSFCYIGDFIEAFKRLSSPGVESGIYNIGTKDEISILTLAQLISNTCGQENRFTFSSEPLGETSKRIPDISKIETLGFRPLISITEGLELYFRWYKKISISDI